MAATALHAATVFAFLVGAPALGQVLEPVDQATHDASLFAFRAEVMDAVVQRDADWIVDILSDDVLSSFGGDGGVDEFVAFYQLDDPDSRFWIDLGWALANGGAFLDDDKGMFQAPYWSSSWPQEVDPFEYVLVRGVGVPAVALDGQGDPLALLSGQIVRWVDEVPDVEAVHVRLSDGRDALVPVQNVESPVGYRVTFERIGGRWTLTSFVAGD